MGGNAFGSILRPAAFPRIPPTVYRALRARMLPLLEELYTYVGIPHVAPEKADHGDLDLIVCLPREHNVPIQGSSGPIANTTPGGKQQLVNVPNDTVAAIIKAKHFNSMDGNRTSNFAVPVPVKEWVEFGLIEGEAEQKARENAGEEGIFYQVDVNVCESEEEWGRRILFHSYGDLGMTMGLIAKNAGLHLGEKGLRFPDQPNPPLLLSESFGEIFEFFGWSMDEWDAGFQTNTAAYDWALSSKFVDPSQFRTQGHGIKKRKPDRKMYAGFLEYASTLSRDSIVGEALEFNPDGREAALDFFKKRPEMYERRNSQKHKKALKGVFSGVNVRDWTDLGNYWLGVKQIMDGVRERLGGDEKISILVSEEGEEELRRVVLAVQAELGVWPKSKTEVSQDTAARVEDVDAELVQGVKELLSV